MLTCKVGALRANPQRPAGAAPTPFRAVQSTTHHAPGVAFAAERRAGAHFKSCGVVCALLTGTRALGGVTSGKSLLAP